ncbi:MAG: PEP-CTERM sorting domain-containing protein [Armatimonadetes bacterium]|nr:PEP-CTERM sorting domain-containing protein [Armatimonadota bacterium]
MYKALAILVASACVAAAQAVNLDIHGMVPGFYQTVTINHGSGNVNVYSGAQSVSIDGAPDVPLYCVDLDHNNQNGFSYGATVNPVGVLANAAQIANLFSNSYADVTDADTAAAFQLVLWDVVVDGGDGMAAGTFTASGLSGGVASKVSLYAATLNTGGPDSYNLTVYVPTSHGANGNNYQALIGAEGVPEPATFLVLGAAAILARKRKKA